MIVTAEFLIEPFSEGSPGPHVEAAISEIESAGLVVEMGPFGTTTTGEAAAVLAAVSSALERALAAGASRVSLSISADRS